MHLVSAHKAPLVSPGGSGWVLDFSPAPLNSERYQLPKVPPVQREAHPIPRFAKPLNVPATSSRPCGPMCSPWGKSYAICMRLSGCACDATKCNGAIRVLADSSISIRVPGATGWIVPSIAAQSVGPWSGSTTDTSLKGLTTLSGFSSYFEMGGGALLLVLWSQRRL